MSRPVCPHCGEPLARFTLPENTGWESEYQLACFNDACPYYRRGWERMREHYAVAASYRYRLDPSTGEISPLAVWSESAMKDRILEEDRPDPPAAEPDGREGDDS